MEKLQKIRSWIRSKVEQKSSLESKETIKRHLEWFSDFRANSNSKSKKCPKSTWNSVKSVFLKFQWQVCFRHRSGIVRFVHGRSRSAPKSSPNLFYLQWTKIDDFIQKFLPPPPFLIKNGGVKILNVDIPDFDLWWKQNKKISYLVFHKPKVNHHTMILTV